VRVPRVLLGEGLAVGVRVVLAEAVKEKEGVGVPAEEALDVSLGVGARGVGVTEAQPVAVKEALVLNWGVGEEEGEGVPSTSGRAPRSSASAPARGGPAGGSGAQPLRGASALRGGGPGLPGRQRPPLPPRSAAHAQIGNAKGQASPLEAVERSVCRVAQENARAGVGSVLGAHAAGGSARPGAHAQRCQGAGAGSGTQVRQRQSGSACARRG
jgi:hypothetical protein